MSITPAGWYPDPRGISSHRWWDGVQWTEHVPQPYSLSQQSLEAPAGTKPYTAFIWILVFIPLVSLIALSTFDFGAYMRSSMTATGPLDILTPQYVALLAASYLSVGVAWLLAFLDWRALKARGVPRPFHFAWVFLYYPAYIFGRSIVVRRRTGSGIAPMWVFVGVMVLGLIVGVAVSVSIIMGAFSPTTNYYY